MDRQLVAVLDDPPVLVDVVEAQLGVDALAEQVERKGDHVDVAGALPVTEQGALHPLRPSHQPEFGGGDRGAAVVVRV